MNSLPGLSGTGNRPSGGCDFVFVIDPVESLAPGHDTSVALMEAAQLAGHRVLTTSIAELGISDGRATARCRELRVRPAVLTDQRWIVDRDWWTCGEPQKVVLDDVAAVFMRTDPPVDRNYLRATFVLDLVDTSRTLMVNAPRGLRDANEKIFALRFPDLSPPTLVSADRDEISDIVGVWGRAVLKPTDGMGGRGIMLLTHDDPNLHSILDTATVRGTEHVVVQQFIPQVSEGDRRVIVLDGQPLGAIRRVAMGEEFRCNMANGARVFADVVTDRDREICAVLGPELSARGIYFAGIDVIGDRLTEVNVTSPTGIREVDALSGTHLAADIISWTVERSAALASLR